MAKLFAVYVLHRASCTTFAHRREAPCPCDPYEVVVEAHFTVPPGAGIPEAIAIARRAGHFAARRALSALDAGRG